MVRCADADVAAAALAARIDRVPAEQAKAPGAADVRHAYAVSRYSWTQAARAHLSIMTELV